MTMFDVIKESAKIYDNMDSNQRKVVDAFIEYLKEPNIIEEQTNVEFFRRTD